MSKINKISIIISILAILISMYNNYHVDKELKRIFEAKFLVPDTTQNIEIKQND